jgi:aldose 1-epimerase
MAVRTFGTLPDGTKIDAVTIAAGALRAEIITWGAVLRDLRIEGHAPPLVLGFETLEPYPAHSPHFGAIAGRYANRINGGQFTLDGVAHQLDLNQIGRHHLHGGGSAFGKRPWRLAAHGPDFVTLTLHSAAGEAGYPGNLDVTCTYRIAAPGTLRVELGATTDAATLVNLAHHGYFNLDGSADIGGHTLQIIGDRITETDVDLIPTGRLLPVAGTAFDFRAKRKVASAAGTRYDTNFCLSDAKRAFTGPVVRAEGGDGRVAMEVWTTEPGVQFYDGHKVAVPVPGLEGRIYGARAGFCLEPQVWPDAPNHTGFPSAVLRPGETYAQSTEYRFQRR